MLSHMMSAKRIVKKEILVSVIIPTYNRKKTILSAIYSVLKQTYTKLEVIVVDDGSTDGTGELIKKTIKDERLVYIKLKKNKGQSAARNVGVKRSIGEIIAFQDSDDIWDESKLELQIKKMQDTNYDLIYCAYEYYERDGKKIIVPNTTRVKELEGYIYNSLCNGNKIGTPTMIMKRDTFEKMGGFDESLRSLEDWDFVLRYSQEYTIGYYDGALVHVTKESQGVNALSKRMIDAYIEIIRRNKEAIGTNGIITMINKLMELGEMEYDGDLVGLLVPDIISSISDLKVILYFAENRFKNKCIINAITNVLSDGFSHEIDSFKEGNRRIIIRGAGTVGNAVLAVLKKKGDYPVLLY